ncbi:MAG TPA: hypothetical protein VMG32_04860 [Anaeromyxobacteraceae bacterium]|nr:hypothetical protein [Anaeromyxobacteraceae bacterium]
MASLKQPLALALLLALVPACSGRREEAARGIFRAGETAQRPSAFDPARPLDALAFGADEAAARLGSLAFAADVTWSVERPGAPTLRATEHHRLRQLASGEFDLSVDLDPTAEPGSETGKRVVFARGMTYARARFAPFRQRSADQGLEARRERDQSFRMASELALLYGPALAVASDGEGVALGRRALRYRLSLSGQLPRPAPLPPGLPGGAYDPDTQRRVDFLEGRVPVALKGELWLDAETGVPLKVSLQGAFGEQKDPQLRAELSLSAAVTALGAEVPAVAPPPDALPDEHRPRGVARALEAAGLRKPAAGKEREVEEEPDEPGAAP